MKNKTIAVITLILTLCIMFSTSTVALASSTIKQDENVIILRTEEDWKKMNEDDLAEYNTRLESISPTLKKDVSSFLKKHTELSSMPPDHKVAVNNDLFLVRFIEEYPEYSGSKSEILNDVNMLRANATVTVVRAFFSSKGYDLSLALFNHSLTENPAKASLSLTGNTGGIYSHIRSELSADPFLNKMKIFANKNGTQTLKDSSYTFEKGDLLWAIHGFTWTRKRLTYGTATFAIDDVYDFKKWEDLPGVVAALAGTHDFDVHIAGRVQNGVIK